MPDRYADILVVDLLGGIGDLVMILPAIHGLARHHPAAGLRVITHPPGDVLLRGDPAVTQVRTPSDRLPGAARRAVEHALADRRPDLAVSTTRYDGIPDLLGTCSTRCVTDLWRRPPADELVTTRYLRILIEEGLLEPDDMRTPQVYLSPAERGRGRGILAGALDTMPGRAPVLLVTDTGMGVKRWPDRHWQRLVHALSGRGHPVLGVTANPFTPALPPGDLRQLAACFAAVAERGGVVVGGDTGPLRLAAAAGAATVALFGPTLASRYGLRQTSGRQLQGMPQCRHRRPTAITEQVCWWNGTCPLESEPACMTDISPEEVTEAVLAVLSSAMMP
jgi:ADP-heptose:LPS heptosyltransferase